MTPLVPARAPLPSVDAIAADPGRAADLTPAVALALYQRAVIALAALAPALVPHEEDAGLDRLLTVREASLRLRFSADYLYRHAREFSFFVQPNGGRAIRFSERGIERYLREQQGRQES